MMSCLTEVHGGAYRHPLPYFVKSSNSIRVPFNLFRFDVWSDDGMQRFDKGGFIPDKLTKIVY